MAAVVERAPTAAGAQPRSVVDYFLRSVREMGDRPAMYTWTDAGWAATTWRAFGDAARQIAAFLVTEGVPQRAPIAIWSGNREEWHVADAGLLMAHGRTVPVYLTLSAEQAAYVLGHSEAQVAFVQDEGLLGKVLEVRDRLPALRRVVVFDEPSALPQDGFAIPWREALRRGEAALGEVGAEIDRRIGAIEYDDVATFIYTSGTTGPPKAVRITHRNMDAALSAFATAIHLTADDRVISYLPLAHVVERLSSEFRQFVYGNAVYFAAGIDHLGEHLRDVRPTFFFGVPRVWEKIAAQIETEIGRSTGLRRSLAHWALSTGGRVVDRRQAGRPVARPLATRHALADRLVLSRIREAVGLDQAHCVSGAAPLSPDVTRFFHSLGIELCEAYGMSENVAVTTMNRRGQARVGTVGPALPGIEVRLADDGEILVRGDVVFDGYEKDPEATAGTLRDGWLYTGDVGELEPDGHLRITDRKKDLLITAGGKNIAPSNIETALMHHPLISTAVAIGDRRPFVTALLTLDMEEAASFAREHALDPARSSLVGDPVLHAEIQRHVDDVNAHLAHVEQVKRWRLLDRDFAIGEELTPTYKVRRKFVAERYAGEIDALYAAGR